MSHISYAHSNGVEDESDVEEFMERYRGETGVELITAAIEEVFPYQFSELYELTPDKTTTTIDLSWNETSEYTYLVTADVEISLVLRVNYLL